MPRWVWIMLAVCWLILLVWLFNASGCSPETPC